MRLALVLLSLALWTSAADAATGNVLIVVTDDRELATAIASAASQQYPGPVALAPRHWQGPLQPGMVRVQVSHLGARRWRVTLSNTVASVSRDLGLSQHARKLDLAEALGLAIPGLLSRLETRTKAAKSRALPPAAKPTLPNFEAAAALCPAPRPAAAPALKVGAQAVLAQKAADHPMAHGTPPAAPIPPRRWTVGLEPGLFFASRVTAAPGGEAMASFAITQTWLAEASFGGYFTYVWQYDVETLPLDAFVAARARWGRFFGDIGLGPELVVSTSSIGSGATVGVAGEASAGMQLSRAWQIGLRAVVSYTPGNPDIGPSGAGSTDGSIHLSQGLLRLGVFAAWQPR